ncbi:hypothetical protein [Streptomyces venetus]
MFQVIDKLDDAWAVPWCPYSLRALGGAGTAGTVSAGFRSDVQTEAG